MAAQQFLVKLTPYDVPNNIYTAVVVDPSLGIWGGPFDPPRIWGPTDPRPGNPISGIPGLPGYEPPKPPLGIWGPNDPRPSPPIAFPPGWIGGIPPPGTEPPTEPPTPEAKGDWKYATKDGAGGWFFLGVVGPFDKPHPLG